MIKSYKELIRLETFNERFEYLKLGGIVGATTFGFDRHLNQILYRSKEWLDIRNQIMIRDDGCDLGIHGREIFNRIVIHHINPITSENLDNRDDCIFDPNNLISTVHNTHLAIHYGDLSIIAKLPKERSKGDTCPWKVY